jgi:hypothetical protein
MNFWNNLKDGGYVLFHDYGLQPGVTEFVDDWVMRFEQAIIVEQKRNIIVLQKL